MPRNRAEDRVRAKNRMGPGEGVDYWKSHTARGSRCKGRWGGNGLQGGLLTSKYTYCRKYTVCI